MWPTVLKHSGLKSHQLFVKFTAHDHFLPVPKQRLIGCRNTQAVHLQC